MANNNGDICTFTRSHSVEVNLREPQSSGTSPVVDDVRPSRVHSQRRTVEGSRLLRDNLNSVMREIQPFVETARSVNALSLSALLGRPTYSEPNVSTTREGSDSFVINLDTNRGANTGENEGVYIHMHNQAANALNNMETPASQNGVNEDRNNGPNAESLGNVLEAQQYFHILQKYIPFVLILTTKGFYDHREGILNFIVLLATFTHTNSVVQKEAMKHNRRSFSRLFLAALYITASIVFIDYVFEDELYMNLVFVPFHKEPLTVWDLLWTVGITDFILKLITVMIKILFTTLPAKIIAFQKRGKIYLFIESTSQLYRSLVTIQPWLYYLLESYQGPEKIVGVFLSAAYMVSKGADLVSRLKLFKTSALKLLQNVTLGSSPSKDQIQTAGSHCPICHDEYESPVLLQCRHIFCESCVSTWFDREQTCPLCRAKIVEDPSWRDGSTTFFMQLF